MTPVHTALPKHLAALCTHRLVHAEALLLAGGKTSFSVTLQDSPAPTATESQSDSLTPEAPDGTRVDTRTHKGPALKLATASPPQNQRRWDVTNQSKHLTWPALSLLFAACDVSRTAASQSASACARRYHCYRSRPAIVWPSTLAALRGTMAALSLHCTPAASGRPFVHPSTSTPTTTGGARPVASG